MQVLLCIIWILTNPVHTKRPINGHPGKTPGTCCKAMSTRETRFHTRPRNGWTGERYMQMSRSSLSQPSSGGNEPSSECHMSSKQSSIFERRRKATHLEVERVQPRYKKVRVKSYWGGRKFFSRPNAKGVIHCVKEPCQNQQEPAHRITSLVLRVSL